LSEGARNPRRAPADGGDQAPARAQPTAAVASGPGPTLALAELLRRGVLAVAAGVGVVGWVVVVGAGIEWARFQALDVPGDQAVAAVPKQQLIVVGAVSATLSLLAGALAVALAYAVDPEGKSSRRMAAFLGALGLLGVVAAIASPMSGAHVALLAVAAAFLMALAVIVAHVTASRFLGFGCAVFVCILVFAGGFAYLIDLDQQQAQAVALVGPSGGKLSGLFVARDRDRIWIATTEPAGLSAVSCEAVSAIAIGRVEPVGEALRRASVLLDRLQQDHGSIYPGPPGSQRPAGERPRAVC
jgi:hypothetical protein